MHEPLEPDETNDEWNVETGDDFIGSGEMSIQLPDEDEVVEAKPPYELYFEFFVDLFGGEALQPRDRAEKSGYLTIFVYVPESNQPVVKIIRHISAYVDNFTGVQDEIFFSGRNTGAQLNFELDDFDQLVEFPRNDIPSELMQEAMDTFQQASVTEGATLQLNYEIKYISDGSQWIPYIKPGPKKLAPGNSQIEDNPTQGLEHGEDEEPPYRFTDFFKTIFIQVVFEELRRAW